MSIESIRAAFLDELGKIAAEVPSRGDMRDKKLHDVQKAGQSIKGHSYGAAPEGLYEKMAHRIVDILAKTAAGELSKKQGDVPSDEPSGKGSERSAGRSLGSSGGGHGGPPRDENEYVNAARFYGSNVSLRDISPTIHADSQYAPSTSNPLDKLSSVQIALWFNGLNPLMKEAFRS